MKNRATAGTMLLLLASGCVGTLPLLGQSPAPSSSKVGAINLQAAISNCAEGKKIMGDLQVKYDPQQKQIQHLQQEIRGIEDQLTKRAINLSDEDQARLNRDAEDKQKLLKRTAEDAQNDFGRDRDEATNKIGQKMVQVINEYAQQNGFSLILDDAQIPVYFAARQIEVTNEVVKRYDATYPVVSAAASSGSKP